MKNITTLLAVAALGAALIGCSSGSTDDAAATGTTATTGTTAAATAGSTAGATAGTTGAAATTGE